MTQPIVTASALSTSASTNQPELASVLLGPSAAMSHLWSQLRRLAPHVRCVLLTGEAFCGQEAVARVLLELSPNRFRRFLNLAPEEMDSKLLASGALASIPQDAFLFLPDIDRASPASQAALLQLMRLRRGRAFTVVATTSEKLRALVSLGRFSPELAAALGMVQLSLPSLRDRKEDLPVLLTHHLSAGAGRSRPVPVLGKDLLHAAMQHPWSGNLDELARAAAALLSQAASPETELSLPDFHASLARLAAAPDRSAAHALAAPPRLVPLNTVMQEHICLVLKACRGNKLRAAEVLGISRSTLYRMLDAGALQTAALPLAS